MLEKIFLISIIVLAFCMVGRFFFGRDRKIVTDVLTLVAMYAFFISGVWPVLS